MPTCKQLEHSGSLRDQVNGFDVIDCERCQFTHVVPLPSAEELERTYRSDYYTNVKPKYIERTREDLEWWNAVYDEWFESFERFLHTERRRILDVGCGPGFFLLNGQQRGWQTLGIEPSSDAAAHARSLGLEIINEFLSSESAGRLARISHERSKPEAQAKWRPDNPSLALQASIDRRLDTSPVSDKCGLGVFDVVHLHEVLEHVASPLETLQIAHTLLEPGGLLSLVVPNDYNPLQSLVQRRCSRSPWWVVPPHHLNYFSVDSLTRLVRKAGFNVLKRTTTFPLELFLLMGDDYIGNDAIGRHIHEKRKRLELALRDEPGRAAKQRIYALLARLGIGREIVLLARKDAVNQQRAATRAWLRRRNAGNSVAHFA